MSAASDFFWMGDTLATDLLEVTDDPSKLDGEGFWAVAQSFEGAQIFARFNSVIAAPFPKSEWRPLHGEWISTHSRTQYCEYVEKVRSHIESGDVYQVNACRKLRYRGPERDLNISALFSALLDENPAPYASFLRVNEQSFASASPERFFERSSERIIASPIKGTAPTGAPSFGSKDKAENLMIVDLMRNDLGKIAVPGSVEVSELFRREEHPTISHLVSDVVAELPKELSWKMILAALSPAGSVSGAPKSSALKIIRENEDERGMYCGALGWVQGREGKFAVGIRTFEYSKEGALEFGTGAGITWASDAQAEWEETQLKARHLISIAGGALHDH